MQVISKIVSFSKRIKKKIQRLLYKKSNKNRIESKLNPDKNNPVGNFNQLFKEFHRKGLICNYILDVGAHTTEWIRIAMKVYPEATVYLIEPLQEMEEKLKQFCVEFPKSRYYLNGAGAKEEILLLTLSGVLEGANFLEGKNNHLISVNKQREIKIITIDSLIKKKEIEIPDIVKLDIQGFELEALKGASLLFGKTEVFILEVSFFEFIKGTPIFSDVIRFMADRGYEAYDFPSFLRRPYDNALGQMDICFVKREGFIRSSNNWE